MKQKLSLLPGCMSVYFPLSVDETEASATVPTETALFPVFPRCGCSQTSRGDRSKAIFN